jgi:two-component system, chemotaxis family, CheB/CheR fusion protein
MDTKTMDTKEDPKNETLKNSLTPNQFIIGIGASAGGMEAIHTLFDNTLTDAVSYVIIQHISADHKSLMAELLVKHSKLKIYEAEHEMEIQSNCIYVIPHGKNMTIADGKLILSERKNSTPNSSIDIFFNSLAEDQGNKSIGIVLAGNGSDGTRGVGAIKRVGGMVIVQDPESTEYTGMPNSAIESGFYDYILTPRQIPQQIVSYIKQKVLAKNFSDTISDKNNTAISEVINLIKEGTPLDFSEYKRPTIVRRIVRRMIANDVNTMEDYIHLLKSSPSEMDVLSKEFMISVTRFFRDPAAFEIIRDKVIPEIVGNKLLIDVLKIWVIGCATGEEAYSLAILIREHLTHINKNIEVKIFASDIDKDALAKASKGKYSENIARDVSEERLNAFFMKEGNAYKVKENIRNMIIFADHDIVHQPPYGKIDLISCRNLLIYLNITLQRKIFSSLHFCLNTGGYLFLGPSEGTGDLKDVFLEIDKKWKIYKNIGSSGKAGFGQYSTHHIKIKPYNDTSISSKLVKPSSSDNFSDLIHQSQLEELGYQACVSVDKDSKIILPFGDFQKFLLPKLFNNNLLEILPSELSIAVGTSLQKAFSDNIKVTVKNIKFTEMNAVRSVKIFVKPFSRENKSFQKIAFVYFAEEETENNAEGVVEIFNSDLHTERYFSNMEQELSEVKIKLQEAYHALEESTNNVQSYNEELISGNEEMQSSNEELQSINEELHTVNNEYQVKIKEVAELNDDLNNYFRSTYNSQLCVDKKLLIKRFTPVSIQQINVKESDIGRPLSDLSTNIKSTSLIDDIHTVINTQKITEKQIETIDGKWYMMMIVPYIRSQDQTTDGAIITFNDITEIKKSKEIIKVNNNKLVKINQDHDTFIYSVSHDLKAPLNNMEGLVSALKDSNDANEIKELSGLIMKSVTTLKETISELSDITKIEKVSENEGADVVNISDLLDEIKISIRDILIESKAKVNIDLDEKEVRFLKKNLRSILFNLLSNAVKYRSKDRELEVDIKSTRSDGYIVLSIEDNGLGIEKEKIKSVFAKFKRIHDDQGANVDGTGIGLYLINKIITNAGGKIEVTSKRGRGSCFKVYFKEPV